MGKFSQYHIKEQQRPGFENFSVEGGRTVLKDGSFESPNFKTGEKGWKVNSEGEAEFQDVSIATIDIGGADASSFHVDKDGNLWLGASTYASAPFKVSNAGILTSANLTRLGGLYTRTNVTTTGTDVLTLSIPANTMGANGTLRITMMLTNNSGNSVIVDTKYGGTVFANDIPIAGGVGVLSKQVIDITNLGATNDQVGSVIGLQTTVTTLQVNDGAVDTTLAKDVVVTVITGGGGIDCFVEFIFVELIV